MKQDTFTAIVFGFVVAAVIFMFASASNYKLENDSDKGLAYESLQLQKDTNLENNIINDKTNELDNNSEVKNTVNDRVEDKNTNVTNLSNEVDNNKPTKNDESLNKSQTIDEDNNNENLKSSNDNSVVVEEDKKNIDDVQDETIDKNDIEKNSAKDETLKNGENSKDNEDKASKDLNQKFYPKYSFNNNEGKSVVLVDKSKGNYCAQVIDVFYSDAHYDYYFTCLKSPSMYVIKNGKEYKLVDALKNGIVTISELEANGYTFLKKSKNVVDR